MLALFAGNFKRQRVTYMIASLTLLVNATEGRNVSVFCRAMLARQCWNGKLAGAFEEFRVDSIDWWRLTQVG